MKHFFSRFSLIYVLCGMILVSLPLLAMGEQDTSLVLPVPYLSQAPQGRWVAPWDEACEETSALMIDYFYQNKRTIPTSVAVSAIESMVAWENQQFKKNTDTNAEETAAIIDAHMSFATTIVRNPSIDAIKSELQAGRPVIALLNMDLLYREPPQHDPYHVVVLIGFDDEKQEFILHDPARDKKNYFYTTVMNSLHDYNNATKKPDGPPTVLFTSAKKITPPETTSWWKKYVEAVRNIF